MIQDLLAAVTHTDPSQALGHLQRAHASDPSNRETALTLARTYCTLDLPHEMLAVLDRLPVLDHEATIVHANALRLLGREREAARESVPPLLEAEVVPEQARRRPRWDGRALAGQTLIVHPSVSYLPPGYVHVVGFGDMIQAIGLCEVLAERDGVRILAS